MQKAARGSSVFRQLPPWASVLQLSHPPPAKTFQGKAVRLVPAEARGFGRALSSQGFPGLRPSEAAACSKQASGADRRLFPPSASPPAAFSEARQRQRRRRWHQQLLPFIFPFPAATPEGRDLRWPGAGPGGANCLPPETGHP